MSPEEITVKDLILCLLEADNRKVLLVQDRSDNQPWLRGSVPMCMNTKGQKISKKR